MTRRSLVHQSLVCSALWLATTSGEVMAVETAPRITDREIIESLTRLDAGQQALAKEMHQRFEAMEEGINQRFEAVDQRFVALEENINQRFEAVDQRFEALEENINQRFEAVDQRFEAMEEGINQRFEAVDRRFVALEENINQRFKAVDQRFVSIDQRFASMEKNMDQRFAALNKRLDDQFAMSLAMFSAIILLIVSLFGYIVWDRRTALRPLETRLAQLEQDLERDLQLRHEQGSLPTRLLNALRDLAQEDEKLARVLRSFSLF